MEQLLATKLYIPPTRLRLVSRPLLVEQLNDGLHRKLTLISAPAGFGKTTLVSEWVENLPAVTDSKTQKDNSVAWISLDENDSDLVRFLTYFITAIKQVEGVDVSFGEGALGMLRSPQTPSAKSILTLLINEITAIPGRIILVLDDYHLISAPQIDEALTFLLENMPPHLHMTITTRVDPPLPLARLRASDQLNELRGTELRFTSSEVSDFLNGVMDLGLSIEDLRALEIRTEGWIAGLQLAAISMQGHENTSSLIKSFTGSHRLVLDYLIEEVLGRQPELVQNFLMKTSVLKRFTGSLCDALTGQNDGQLNLEMLDHANLFIVPLDEERHWYRYHHLFADLLLQRLHRSQPGDIPILHHHASLWYGQNGFSDEAIDHALQSDDMERALSLVEEQVDLVWERGEHTKLWRWLANLSDDMLLSSPLLCIYKAWYQFTRSLQDAAENTLHAAEKALAEDNRFASDSIPPEKAHLPDHEGEKILGRAATIRAYLAFHRGDIQNSNRYAHQAVELLPDQDRSWRATALVALGDAYNLAGDLYSTHRIQLEALEANKKAGNTYMVLITGMKLMMTLRCRGNLVEILERCKQQLKLANDSGMSEIMEISLLFGLWGDVLAEMDKLDEALEHAEIGVERAERGKEIGILGWSYLRMIRVLYSRGNLPGVEEFIRKINDFTLNYQVPHWLSYRKAAWQVKVWLAQNKLDTAIKWADELELDIEGSLKYHNVRDYISYARILITRGQEDGAIKVLSRLQEATKVSGNRSRELEVLILKALAFQEQSDMAQALTILEEAFKLAEPEGFVRTFVDEGPPMAKLLFEAVSNEIAPDYANVLLKAFRIPEYEQSKQAKEQISEFYIEALSQREIEVLTLVAEGLTNQEIASRLYLSQNTVKVHTRNIFGKLNVKNRTEAVSRAKALGILN